MDTGGRLIKAKEALKLFLHSLPEYCNFSIISYGTYSDFLTVAGQKVIQYNEENALDALSQIDRFTAYTGNNSWTNIEGPMQKAIDMISTPALHKRVILLTDGKINRGGENDVVTKQAENEDIVVHTLGMSDQADANLLQAVAEAGRGTFNLV